MRHVPEATDRRCSSFTRWCSWENGNILLGLVAAGLFLNAYVLMMMHVGRRRETPVMVGGDVQPPFAASPFRMPTLLPDDIRLPSWKPLPDELPTRLAFGSCSDQRLSLTYWDTLMYNDPPDVFLMMGDNVYGDCRNDNCDRLADAYRNLSRHGSFSAAAPHIPVAAVLDDHDYGQSDCHADNPHKDVALGWFGEFFDIPEESLEGGVYRSYEWADEQMNVSLQLILLDTRYHRDPFRETKRPSHPYEPVEPTTAQNMLGASQWEWLEEQILGRNATLRILVSSVQVLNDSTGFEAWRHLPNERDRLHQLLTRNGSTTPTLILSGDRHAGSFSQWRGLYEVTASSLTHSTPLGTFTNCTTPSTCDEEDPSRQGDMIRENHFGSIEIHWETKEIVVALQRSDTPYGAHYGRGRAGDVLVSKRYSFADSTSLLQQMQG